MSDATHVLLVDDDEVDVLVVKRAFRKRGVGNRITVAKHGLEALRLLREGAVAQPRLILLDLNMPRMNGLEFLEALRSEPDLGSTPVFVLTTSRAATDRRQALALGASGYISKCRFAEEFWSSIEGCGAFVPLTSDPPRAAQVTA